VVVPIGQHRYAASVIRKAVLLFVLAVALAAPSVASAGEPASYPAAGPVVKPSVVIRANPKMGSKKLLLLRDYREDGLTQYVLAVSGRRIGVVAARHAKLTLKNIFGVGAFVLTARKTGKAGNRLTAAVVDELAPSDPESGQDYLIVVSRGTKHTIPFSTDAADLGALATAVNGMSLRMRATATGTGQLAFASSRHLAGGKAGKAGKLWLRVVIPARPLNRRGWIPASAAHVKATNMRITVNRNTHWLKVFDGTKRVLKTRVATGRSDRPTPLGLFYVAAKYRPPENAAVTAFALELSAPAGLPDFALGGVIGIHGTHLLSSLGHNASNGCIRVAPSAALRLKKLIPSGTPVRVVG
jgi:lipoprotein-anchoring transpeptidase ErfK/SrfK